MSSNSQIPSFVSDDSSGMPLGTIGVISSLTRTLIKESNTRKYKHFGAKTFANCDHLIIYVGTECNVKDELKRTSTCERTSEPHEEISYSKYSRYGGNLYDALVSHSFEQFMGNMATEGLSGRVLMRPRVRNVAWETSDPESGGGSIPSTAEQENSEYAKPFRVDLKPHVCFIPGPESEDGKPEHSKDLDGGGEIDSKDDDDETQKKGDEGHEEAVDDETKNLRWASELESLAKELLSIGTKNLRWTPELETLAKELLSMGSSAD